MSCPYSNKEKDSIWNGIYCNRMGGRPGVKYWDCYCNHRYSDCPIYGGDDPYELDPNTRERKKREEDHKKSNEVVQFIERLSSSISLNDEREIENVRYAYNRLTNDQKNYVSNYYKLLDAERALARAKADKEQEEIERKAQERRQKEEAERKAQENKQKETSAPISKTEYAIKDSIETSQNTNSKDNHTDTKNNSFLHSKFQGYQDKFWVRVSPYWNKPSVLVIVSRIVLAITAILAWHYGLPYHTPRAAEWMYLIWGVGQLLSFVFAYLLTDQHNVRLITWGVCGLALVIMIVLLYLNYNFKMILFLVLITFCVPILWYGSKLLIKIGELVMKLLTK